MKKIVIALFAGLILLNLSSCADPDMNYSYSIKDALKISAYLFDDSVDMNEPIYYDDDTEYTLEQLKLNEVRLMMPQGAMQNELNTADKISACGLVLYLEFDGIIKVVSENEYVRLARMGVSSYDMQLAFAGYVDAYPLRVKQFNENDLYEIDKFVPGTEYILNVNAYNFDNDKSPIIRAKIKLVALEDAANDAGFYNDGKPESRCVSIELISYEYSDAYKLMDEITDFEDN
ncbi:MAG: hypothetical protein FWD71_15925 [Oscillospiraceae bacterium]|nr:hypothetical protein [Oscillospiraceae bacterium]